MFASTKIIQIYKTRPGVKKPWPPPHRIEFLVQIHRISLVIEICCLYFFTIDFAGTSGVGPS